MRSLISYASEGAWSVAANVDGGITDLGACGWGDGRPVTMRALLESGPDAPDRALDLAAVALADGSVEKLDASEIVLGPVISDPDKIICVGANYQDHLDEGDYPAPPYPEVFAKYPNALIGSDAAIPITAASAQVDWEGELAFVIGRRCRNVTQAEALTVIAGYTVVNDISARDIQLRVKQWVVGKSLDGYAPLGPALVPTSEVPDPGNLDIETRLNGDVVQKSNSRYLIFDIPRIVEYLSSLMTLVPGDVVCTGTPGGVGFYRDPQVFLKDGDTVEVEVQGVGTLRNPVRADR